MVVPLLAFVSLPGGNQPNRFAAQGVGDHIKPPFNFAESEPPFLAIIAAGVLSVLPLRIQKEPDRVLERHAMLGDVMPGLPLVPFVFQFQM
jgi:hypothetical protein